MHPESPALVELIYGAIAEPKLWDDVASTMRNLIGADSSVVFSTSTADQLVFVHDTAMDVSLRGDYSTYYCNIDEWRAGAISHSLFVAGNTVTDDMLVNRTRFLRSEFFNDFAKKCGFDRMCGIIVEADKSYNHTTNMSFFRKLGEPGFDRADLECLKPYLPHLTRAFRTVRSLRTASARWGFEFIETLGWAVLLLDGMGKVRVTNSVAAKLAQDGDGFQVVGGRVRSPLCPELEAAAVKAARVHGVSPLLHLDFAVPRPSGRSPYLVAIVPLLGPMGRFEGQDVCLAMHVLDPAKRAVDPLARLAALFNLTPAEARLAMDLLHEERLAEIADARAVSIETVRTQLKSLLRKTATDRQAMLMRRLQQAVLLPGAVGQKGDDSRQVSEFTQSSHG